ncbi:peptidyl-prolyl cis-trans isomerase D [Lutibacter sp. Hel_I_33_5]|uniref:peptidylprolyl isomerase n=1 Tax=Lutibacter sp. Hel_I_33_5 TaxID=1566289 RepID=UPI0011A296C2|nr:peptidylprolyl isomerase [Lutibacter sp. Hel_I_33_5]TVZ55808.1 peptidyl-prolyl cis-trans isomerase D [Lutibacter sp. Hel_I_33_5]
MAILSKIRERSMFLILVIGLALFAFVLDPSTIGDFFNSSKVNEIGEVDGETITRQEFAQEIEDYKTRTGNRGSEMQAAKNVWDELVKKKIYKNLLEDAGVSVGEEDVWRQMVNIPNIKNNPEYQNEAGIFDADKFKQFLKDAETNNPQLFTAWTKYMNQLRDNSKITIYNNLVSAGLGASLKEGETKYVSENTKLSAQYVYVPYTSIADSLVTVSDSEIKGYINSHQNEFKTEATRDLAYMQFDISPTAADEETIKAEVAKLLEDKEEFSTVTKGQVIVKGFRNTDNVAEFLSENPSDVNLDTNFKFKNQLSSEIAEGVSNGKLGDVFGPYKDAGFFKISKITEVVSMPDSVKASHILIPFIGSRSATAETKQTEEQAKKTADSLVSVLKRNSRKFTALAKELSADKSNADKGGELDWFNYSRMVPEFRDFAFQNKKGTIGIAKTAFGFHVIKIEDQKNYQNAVKLSTFGRKIIASEATENAVFQESENYAQAISKDVKNYLTISKEKNYSPKPAIGLKVLDENVPGLGNQRQIVSWAFNRDTKIGSYKRFDLEGKHVVAILTKNLEKGLLSPEKANGRVKPILLNEKKAQIIMEKMVGGNLAELSKANNTSVRQASGITLKTPTLTGVGASPKVVGAMINAKENQLYNKIEGTKGVFAFVVNTKELPTLLPNYDAERKRMSEQLRNKTFSMYEAVKKATEIKDERSNFYGI